MFELGRVVARICRHNFTRAQSIVCKRRAFTGEMKNVTLDVHFVDLNRAQIQPM